MAKLPAMNGGRAPIWRLKRSTVRTAHGHVKLFCSPFTFWVRPWSKPKCCWQTRPIQKLPIWMKPSSPSTDTLTESSINLPFMSTILAIHVNYTGCQNPLSTLSDLLSFTSRQRPSPPSWLRLEDLLWPNARTSFRSCLLPRTFLDVELREGFAGLTPQ